MSNLVRSTVSQINQTINSKYEDANALAQGLGRPRVVYTSEIKRILDKLLLLNKTDGEDLQRLFHELDQAVRNDERFQDIMAPEYGLEAGETVSIFAEEIARFEKNLEADEDAHNSSQPSKPKR